MKSNVEKINGYFVCSTTFGNKDEFTYISKFKSDLKGVAYQELKTAVIEKEELDRIKNLGCKNIEIELAKLGYEVSAEELLKHRKEQLEVARRQDQIGETLEDKINWHQTRIANLEAELKQAKADFEAEKANLKKAAEEAAKKHEAMLKKLSSIK